MTPIQRTAAHRPVLFVIALAVIQPALAMVFVVPFRVLGLDLLPLRLIIPAAQALLIFWVIRHLGWQHRAGLRSEVRDIHLYCYPVAVAMLPVLVYGTVPIGPGWILFYTLALLFTGISEEGFARGLAIPALMRHGKWVAVFAAAAIFSAGHVTNAFFEDFDALEWADKFLATFGFAVMYGAVFLRTGNLWPLIVLHMLHDYFYLTSGTAGPFLAEPIAIPLQMAVSLLNLAYGVLLMRGVPERGDLPAGTAAA